MVNTLMNMKSILFLLMIFMIGQFRLQSQSNPTYTVFTQTVQGASSMVGTLTFPNTNKPVTALRQTNKSAKLRFKLDIGDDYVIQNSATWNFRVKFTLNYQFAGNPTVYTKLLEIDNTAPENLKVDDVLPVLNTIPSASPVLTVAITSTVVTDNSTPTSTTPLPSGTLLYNFIQNNIRLGVTLEREYDVDVRLASGVMSTAPTILPVNLSTNRLVTFSWTPVGVDAYPNYEIQVLKLYNTDPAYQNSLNQISTTVDWSKALKVETQNHKNSMKITMAEGTGYYVWRVRPVGNYYKGGIANSENYGEWSNSLPDLLPALLNKNTLTLPVNPTPFAFYFSDPDENINWIYSRVFTEADQDDKVNPAGVKSSEGMNYADGLLNVRQNQKYNSSENTTIVSQTINDYSGRPALTTMPVPVTGNLTGYKLGFVTNSTGDLYTAKMFDENSNENDPEVVNDVTTAYKYYSGNTMTGVLSNSNVPSAEGYPFKRTKFKTDGTNRATEESGIGKVHSLGTQSAGRGRTTRVMYSTPSDDELIRIFGDEAPLAESVIKTTTIDPNNAVTVSYTSKEGKTIATALISESTDNLSPLERAADTYTLNNTVDQSTLMDGKIVASKRVTVPVDDTYIKLSYIPGTLGSGSGCAGGDCNLKLRFYLVDLKNNKTYVSDSDPSTSVNEPFNQTAATPFATPWRLQAPPSSIITPSIAPLTSEYNQIQLPAGEYLFIKEIFSGNGNTAKYADSIMDQQNDKTRLIFDGISAKMQTVTSAASYSVFTQWYEDLRTMIANYTPPTTAKTASLLAHLNISAADVPAGYTFTLTGFSLAPLTQTPSDPTTTDMEVSTSCCGSIKVPIPKPDICYLCTGSPETIYNSNVIATMQAANDAALAASSASTYTMLTPYGIEDFKAVSTFSTLSEQAQRDAIYSLVELEMIKPLKDKMIEENFALGDLWKLAPGYTFESLNYMFSNMLISHYFTGKATKIGSTWYRINSDGTTTDFASLPNTYNYDCKKLYEGWTNAVMMLNSFEAEGSNDIVGGFNDQDGDNSAQNEADDDDNMDDANLFQKALMTTAMSYEMKKFNDSDDGKISGSKIESITSLVSNFMEFVGPQYAAVIDGEALPGYVPTVSGNPAMPLDYATAPATAFPAPPSIAAPSYTTIGGSLGASYVPVLFELSGTTVLTSTITCGTTPGIAQLYYPYVVKPEWAFKYFTYNVFKESTISDDDRIIPNQVLVDISRVYKEPGDYVTSADGYISGVPFCKEPPVYTYTNSSTTYTYINTHEYWSAAERVQFYKEIAGSSKCYENKGVDNVNPGPHSPPCPSKADLVASALSVVDTHTAQLVSNLSSEIKSALYNELISSCYTVVACKSGGPGEVTDKEIDLMVDAVIAKCMDQLLAIRTKLTAFTAANTACNTATTGLSASNYSDAITDLPYSILRGCQDINLLRPTNTLTVTPNTTIEIVLFADCDQKILDMIAQGNFIPYIAPLPGCTTKPPKAVYFTDTKTPCTSSDYEEKSYNNMPFNKYSKTYQIQASN